jgi:hypothetical protein
VAAFNRNPWPQSSESAGAVSIDATQVRAMKAQGLGASEIAKALKIGRASVYRVLDAGGGAGVIAPHRWKWRGHALKGIAAFAIAVALGLIPAVLAWWEAQPP